MQKSIFGLLICTTSGGVMNVNSIKKLLDDMSKMGYNYLEICMEDTYQIESEPYFGYLRGGYSKKEIREIVDYASKYNIEVVPAIQTLAHLGHLTALPMFNEIKDIGDILLIDEPKTYELIDKMFATLRECFDTDKINIGFDEAHLVGLGRYLDKNGYKNRFDLLTYHLDKVCKIAEKYHFTPHIWSDMFFRLNNSGDYYGKNTTLSSDTLSRIPENCELAYWHYASIDKNLYDRMFEAHKQFNRPIWFAGAVGCFNGFAPFNHKSIECTKVALDSAKEHNVDNIIITLWGDDGNECSFFSMLPSLFVISEYHKGNTDLKNIKEKFKKTFKVDFDNFMLLDLPNKTPKNPDIMKTSNPCKCLFYNDCFLGWKDNDVEKEGHIPYEEYAKTLFDIAPRMKKYKPLFINMANLCAALSYKAELGVKTRKAYKSGDKKALAELVNDYKQAEKWVKKFHSSFQKIWLTDNKAIGYEIQEARFGGLESRIKFCKNRILDYLNGKIDAIEELELEILPFANWGLQYNLYKGSISINGI